MAKEILYKCLVSEINHGTEDNPDIERVFNDKFFICPTEAAFNEMMPIVEKEAVPYTIEVTGEFDPDPSETPTELDALDARLTYVEMMTGLMEV